MAEIGRRSIEVLLTLGSLAFIDSATARDLGQWEATDPALKRWYERLKQPDDPAASCCGEADAYWCDDVHVKDGKTFCAVTDDRPDEPHGRPHIAIGTEIEIPANKFKRDSGNPTGHGIVFLTRYGYVYCYIQPGGV